MHTFFLILILLHGTIHLMGFIKAFGLAEISKIKMPISRIWGVFWLLSAFTLILSTFLWLINITYWWIPAMIGVILSHILVFASLRDAHFGSIPNVVIYSSYNKVLLTKFNALIQTGKN